MRHEDRVRLRALRLALTKVVEIVGEAAKHISPELRAAHPEVPWAAAARMRDRFVHHYFDINLDILWHTVSDDLPHLPVVSPPRQHPEVDRCPRPPGREQPGGESTLQQSSAGRPDLN
jgi:hypothetical protein